MTRQPYPSVIFLSTNVADDVSSVIIDGVEMKVKDIENDAAPRLGMHRTVLYCTWLSGR